MGFSRQEYWSGLPSPPPGDLPNPGIKPRSPTLQADSLLSEPPGKPKVDGFLFWAAFCFGVVPLVYLCFHCLSFGVKSKNIIARINVMELMPCFLLGVLQFQILTFEFLIHFKLNFVSGLRWGCSFILLLATVQFPQHHLLKSLSFPPLYILGSFVIN